MTENYKEFPASLTIKKYTLNMMLNTVCFHLYVESKK